MAYTFDSEGDVTNAHAVLAFGNMIEQRWASGWWEDLSKMDRKELERIAGNLIGPQGRFAILRKLVAEAGAP